MTGNFNNGGFKSVNLADPEDEKDAVNKSYPDNNYLPAYKHSNIEDTSEIAYYEPPVFSSLPDGSERWINPPMRANEEYKTLELFDGEPVWIKVVDCGQLPNKGAKSINLFENPLLAHVIDYNSVIRDNNEGSRTVQKFPCYTTSGDLVAIGYINSKGAFNIYTFTDLSFCSGYVMIKYIKVLI